MVFGDTYISRCTTIYIQIDFCAIYHCQVHNICCSAFFLSNTYSRSCCIYYSASNIYVCVLVSSADLDVCWRVRWRPLGWGPILGLGKVFGDKPGQSWPSLHRRQFGMVINSFSPSPLSPSLLLTPLLPSPYSLSLLPLSLIFSSPPSLPPTLSPSFPYPSSSFPPLSPTPSLPVRTHYHLNLPYK